MTAPRTAAGRALATMLWADDTFSKREADEPILAIEAEAAALDVDALAEALAEHLPVPGRRECSCGQRFTEEQRFSVHFAAAYAAILDAEAQRDLPDTGLDPDALAEAIRRVSGRPVARVDAEDYAEQYAVMVARKARNHD